MLKIKRFIELLEDFESIVRDDALENDGHPGNALPLQEEYDRAKQKIINHVAKYITEIEKKA